MSETLVITGGAGSIGSNLAAALAEKNEVVIIDDLSNGKLENLNNLDVQFIQGNVLDAELLVLRQ